MIDSDAAKKSPVVEPNASGEAPALTLRALEQRIRQQEILSKLGVVALQGAAIDDLLVETVRLAAEGLHTTFSKVLEYLPGENCFVVRAGLGWGPDVVGQERVGADLASPAGYALKTGKPVISNHLANEERFRTPELLARNRISRAMNVILQGDGSPFGVLEVDSRSEHDFTEHDIAFLQGAANILGMAIERDRAQRKLKSALERQQVLLKEMNHRVTNSLTIVASMLHLQARQIGNPLLTEQLEEAALRVGAVARAHQRLYQTDDVAVLDIGRYIAQVCVDVDASIDHCEILVDADPDIFIATDRAIAVALAVNELITNAAKHAYKGQAGCKIWVAVKRAGDRLQISVRDEGRGVPEGFDFNDAKGLGMRIINAFGQQLGAEISVVPQSKGAEFVLEMTM